MSGAVIQVDIEGLDVVEQRLLALGRDDWSGLLDAVGGVVESQVRRRISDLKRAPDGSAWPAWSDDYAKTRHSGHSLLENEGDLLDSVQYVVQGDELRVGAAVDYAAAQQYGREEVNLPAREFLGLSDEDASEVVKTIDDFLTDLAEGRR